MKSRLAFVLLTLALWAPMISALAQGGTCESNRQPLESNEFFEAISSQEVKFHEGIFWEEVRSAEGVEFIRYGFDRESAVAAGNAIECRCEFPSVCPKDDCKKSSTGGSATCSGGCYKPDGTACVSCQFFDVKSR